MVACAGCKTTNTLDSAFCRRCGVELAPDLLAEARRELGALVEKGTAAYEDGRIADAAAIAEEATRTDPAAPDAWALMGMVHERRGEVAKALESYERVVELNPDSPLDRLKLSGLRAAIAERAVARPDRRTPLLAGASAAVLLACVGIAAVKLTNRPAPVPASLAGAESASAARETETVRERAVATAPFRTATTLAPGDVPPVGANNPAPTGTAGAGETPDPSGDPSGDAPTSGGRARSGSLPAPRADRSSDRPSDRSGNRPPRLEGSLPPMEISPAPGNTLPGNTLPNPAAPPTKAASRNGAGRPSLDPDPTVQPPPATGGGPATAPRPRPRGDGQIDIQVTDGAGKTPRPRTGGNGGNGAEALTRVGNAHLTGGDNARAASAYENALRAGADPAGVNQRLGQAYERMGRKAEAAQAYSRSAESYRRRIAAGKGDDRAKNGLDSVNQALKVVGRG